MPIFTFEESLKDTENSYELSEEYGVSVELVEYRKKLTKELIESGYYYILDKALFF